MTDWEPATEAEAALRDALRTGDQELYFRILSRMDLLLPVSPDVLAGRAPMGWGTWTTGGRTHVLAFTSPDAMSACLAEHAGSARRVPYHELSDTWPNDEWWLAINPGLPIEGYLPAWFVAQLSRGDVRLPTRAGQRDKNAHATRKSQNTAPGDAAADAPVHDDSALGASAAGDSAARDSAARELAARESAGGGSTVGGSAASVAGGAAADSVAAPGAVPAHAPGSVLTSGPTAMRTVGRSCFPPRRA